MIIYFYNNDMLHYFRSNKTPNKDNTANSKILHWIGLSWKMVLWWRRGVFSATWVHVRYISSPVLLSLCLSVCLSSVTFVRPTQAIEIFRNISTPFGTLAICDLSVKLLRRSSQGNPSVGGVKHKSGSRI